MNPLVAGLDLARKKNGSTLFGLSRFWGIGVRELGSDSIAVVQLSMRSNDEIESDPNSLKQTNNLAAGQLRHALGGRLFGKTRHCHDVTALRDDVTRPG